MRQLTVGDIRKTIKGLPNDMLVYLGDDDELNDIHCGWYAQTEDLTQDEGEYSIASMIKGRGIAPPKNENQTILLIS